MMKKELIKFLVLLSVALGTGPVSAQLWRWSSTASNNATIDPSISWAEGMSPSSVNDSARGMMARLANWRDDLSGKLVATGSTTAWALTSNEGIDPTPLYGQTFTFTAPVTNAAGLTLAVDGGTAYPVYSSYTTPVPSGTLLQFSPYRVKFDGGVGTSGAWMLINFYSNPYTVPVGGMMPYDGATVPNSNFIFPNGQCLSRTTYAAYFAQVGTTHGACDGSTTFAALDARGYAIMGPDGGTGRTGIAVNTAVGSSNITQDRLPNVGLSVSASGGVSTVSTTGGFFNTAGVNGIQNPGAGSTFVVAGNPSALLSVVSTGTASVSGGTSSLNGGITQTLNSNLQPSLAMNYILRIQ